MLDKENVEEMPDVTPNVEQASLKRIASNYQPVTPLATLLSSQLVRQEKTTGQTDSRTGLAAANIIKQVRSMVFSSKRNISSSVRILLIPCHTINPCCGLPIVVHSIESSLFLLMIVFPPDCSVSYL